MCELKSQIPDLETNFGERCEKLASSNFKQQWTSQCPCFTIPILTFAQ